MPWSPETYDHLLAAIFDAMGEKITREFCAKVSEAMGGELSAGSIRSHLFKVRREAGGQRTPSKPKPASAKQGPKDTADASPAKKRTPTRKRSFIDRADLSDDEESPAKVKKEMAEDLSNFTSFFDQDEYEA